MDNDELKSLLDSATPGPWLSEWHKPEPCVVELIDYTQIDGYVDPYGRKADIAQRDVDRKLASLAPELAAEVIRLREGIKDLITSGNSIPVTTVRAYSLTKLLNE